MRQATQAVGNTTTGPASTSIASPLSQLTPPPATSVIAYRDVDNEADQYCAGIYIHSCYLRITFYVQLSGDRDD
jgi:hypothetical protein